MIINWGEPERAPHSRDLHHFFVSYIRLTSVCPIAYNRISTWKTGKLRARAPDTIYIRAAPPARALDPAGLRANCKRPGYSLLSPPALSLNLRRLSVRAVAEISMRRKCAPLLICHLNCTVDVRVHENGRYLELSFP